MEKAGRMAGFFLSRGDKIPPRVRYMMRRRSSRGRGRRAGRPWAGGEAGGAPDGIRLPHLMCPRPALRHPLSGPGAYPTTKF